MLRVPNAALRFKPAGTASQTAASSGAQAAGGANQIKAQRERLEKELALNDEQKTKVETIFNAMRDKLSGVRNAQEADRKKLLERARGEMREQVITPDARAKQKFDEINAESSNRRATGSTTAGRIYVMDENRRPKELNVRVD